MQRWKSISINRLSIRTFYMSGETSRGAISILVTNYFGYPIFCRVCHQDLATVATIKSPTKRCHQHFYVQVLSLHLWNDIYFSLATMFGNFIVLNAFVRNEKLRTINNLYIMNLSAADFCIGLGKFSTLQNLKWANFRQRHQ